VPAIGVRSLRDPSSSKLTDLTSVSTIQPNKLLRRSDSALKIKACHDFISKYNLLTPCYPYTNLLNAVVLALVVFLVLYDGRASNCATFHGTILIIICRNSRHLGVDVQEQQTAGN